MNTRRLLFTAVLAVTLGTGFCAKATPEEVAGKMSLKFARGVVNMATCIGEIPKQTYKTVCDQGAVGAVLGPLKGLGMTAYRGFMGAAETVFFMVPAPNDFESWAEPAFVWEDWEEPPDF